MGSESEEVGLGVAEAVEEVGEVVEWRGAGCGVCGERGERGGWMCLCFCVLGGFAGGGGLLRMVRLCALEE